MKNGKPQGDPAAEIEQILQNQGFRLVELTIKRVKQRNHVYCIVFHPDGFDLDLLSQIHRLIEPKLEVFLEDRDIHIEFSSPGIDRKIKSFHEFEIFKGSFVSILDSDGQWTDGRIEEAHDEQLLLRTARGNRRQYKAEEIVKARLKT